MWPGNAVTPAMPRGAPPARGGGGGEARRRTHRLHGRRRMASPAGNGSNRLRFGRPSNGPQNRCWDSRQLFPTGLPMTRSKHALPKTFASTNIRNMTQLQINESQDTVVIGRRHRPSCVGLELRRHAPKCSVSLSMKPIHVPMI
jgi:hypothetical protein